MTGNDYLALKNVAINCIKKYYKKHLVPDEIINDAYIKLIENRIEYSFHSIKKAVIRAIQYGEFNYPLSLDIRLPKVMHSHEYKVCSRCPENGPQPMAAFPIRKIYLNGNVTYRVACKKCQQKKSVAYYTKEKKTSSSKYKKILKNAREKGRENYRIIKKNPAAYRIFRNTKNEINRNYKARKRQEKINAGWSPNDGNRSPVVARTHNRKIIATFPSIEDAARKIKRNRATLIKAIKNNKACAGYFFEYIKLKKKPNSKRHIPRPFNRKPVIARNMNGNILAKYPSIGEAARKINRSRPNVKRAIRTHTRCGGHYFEFDKSSGPTDSAGTS